jgi:hypothetical protein
VTEGTNLRRTGVITRDEEKYTDLGYIFNLICTVRKKNQEFLWYFLFSSYLWASTVPTLAIKNHKEQKV